MSELEQQQHQQSQQPLNHRPPAAKVRMRQRGRYDRAESINTSANSFGGQPRHQRRRSVLEVDDEASKKSTIEWIWSAVYCCRHTHAKMARLHVASWSRKTPRSKMATSGCEFSRLLAYFPIFYGAREALH